MISTVQSYPRSLIDKNNPPKLVLRATQLISGPVACSIFTQPANCLQTTAQTSTHGPYPTTHRIISWHRGLKHETCRRYQTFRDSGEIFSTKRFRSRRSPRIPFKPPHQTPPMDQIKRTIWLNWGLEAVFEEIDVEIRFGGKFTGFQEGNMRVLDTRCKFSVGCCTAIQP